MQKKLALFLILSLAASVCNSILLQPSNEFNNHGSTNQQRSCLAQHDTQHSITFITKNLRDAAGDSATGGPEPLDRLKEVDSRLRDLREIISKCNSANLSLTEMKSNEDALRIIDLTQKRTTFILDRRDILEKYYFAILATIEHTPQAIELGKQMTELRLKGGDAAPGSEAQFEELAASIDHWSKTLAAERDVSVETIFYLQKYSETFKRHIKSLKLGGTPGQLDYKVRKASSSQKQLLSRIEALYDQSYALWFKMFSKKEMNENISNFVAAKNAALYIELNYGKLVTLLEHACECSNTQP